MMTERRSLALFLAGTEAACSVISNNLTGAVLPQEASASHVAFSFDRLD